MPSAPLIVQSPFKVVETTLGPGVALYRDGFKARMEHRKDLNALLASYDDRIAALEGDPSLVEQATKAILAEKDAAYQASLAANPLPPNPNGDPRIPDEDKRLYTLLEQSILGQAEKDLPNVRKAMESLRVLSESIVDESLARIRDEVERYEKANAKAKRKNRRITHRAKVAGAIGQTVGGILQAIPVVVTQVIGAVISVGSAVAQTAVEIDAARKLAYALRDNGNWLMYEAPLVEEAIEQEEWNLDYLAALDPLAASLEESARLRMRINEEKLKAGIYDEEILARSKKGVNVLWKVAFYGGLAYAAWRLVWK